MPNYLKVKLSCKKPDPAGLTPAQIKYNVATQFLRAYTVTPDPKTYSVKLNVTSVDIRQGGAPDQCAGAGIYEFAGRRADRRSPARGALDESPPRPARQGGGACRSRRPAIRGSQPHRLLAGSKDEDSTLALQQVQNIAVQLSTARTTTSQLEAAQREVAQLTRDPAQALSAPAVAAAPVVENLRVQEATAAAQLASLEGTYGERHPLVVSAKSQLEQLRQHLGEEAQRAGPATRSADAPGPEQRAPVAGPDDPAHGGPHRRKPRPAATAPACLRPDRRQNGL